MVSIRNFKKGDWINFAPICADGQYHLGKTCFLYFLTDTKCIVGYDKEYSNSNKYWFELEVDELSDTKIVDRKKIIEEYENYNIEVLKYKRKNEKYWSNYERTKKDYNWKYDIARGANQSWVYFKKQMIDDYLKDFEDTKHYQDKATHNCLVKSFDDFIDEIAVKMSSHSSFLLHGQSYGDLEINKTIEYYDVMLNNYAALAFKYKHKVSSDIYYLVLDFETLIQNAKNLNKFGDIDITIIDMIMDGYSVDKILYYINSHFTLNKPLTKEKISLKLTTEIPKILVKIDKEINE